MTDQELLQAIREIVHEESEKQRGSIMHDVSALMENDVTPKFNLLAEDLSIIREQLTPTLEKIDRLEQEIDMHHTMLKLHSHELRELRKAK